MDINWGDVAVGLIVIVAGYGLSVPVRMAYNASRMVVNEVRDTLQEVKTDVKAMNATLGEHGGKIGELQSLWAGHANEDDKRHEVINSRLETIEAKV